jgi:hypothetical protein
MFRADESKEQIRINGGSVWVFMVLQVWGQERSVCVLFWDINILLQAANNPEATDGNQSFYVAWC